MPEKFCVSATYYYRLLHTTTYYDRLLQTTTSLWPGQEKARSTAPQQASKQATPQASGRQEQAEPQKVRIQKIDFSNTKFFNKLNKKMARKGYPPSAPPTRQ